MKKVIILLFFVLFLVALYLRFGGETSKSQEIIPVPTQAANPTQEPTSFGTPKRLEIPSLGVDTTIETVGMDAAGNMDVPKDPDNVAWYKLGYKIGSNGSAVIAAHFDKPDGSPAVFYDISSLKPGEKIIVTDDDGMTKTFTVTESTSYPYNAFPLQKVFNSPGESTLNLITCDGTWNKAKKTYSNRLVVYSREVE
jgi:sortase A